MKHTSEKILLAAALAGVAPLAPACTSWMIHPSCTASGRMFLQKCRDSRVTPLTADIRRTRHGVKWMRIGMEKDGALFAVNERGIVAFMNDGDPMATKHINDRLPELKNARIYIGCGSEMRQIMDEATDAEHATRLALHYGRSGLQAVHGGTMLIADAKRGFLIDTGPEYAEAMELMGGLIIISNCMHLPGIEYHSERTQSSMRGDRSREANVRAELKKRSVDGKYTVLGTIETSRLRCQAALTEKYPCRRGSLGGCGFEIDPEFPAELTTAYIALGPQQHTVYLPTPMALEQFPPEIISGAWADMAYQLREQVGFDHKYIARFNDFERRILPEYDNVREEARRLLKAGKKSEAEKLLNDCYKRQYAEAMRLLKEIAADAAANPPQGEKITAAS